MTLSIRVYGNTSLLLLNIQPESCICQPCRNDISHLSEDGFIPRWRKQINKGSTECCVPACTNNVYKVTKLADKFSICNFFSGQDENVNIQPESVVKEEGVGLCKEHYGAWYRHIHPFQTKCKTCDWNMTDISKSRTCPQPNIIQKYLRENTEFSGEIADDDRVQIPPHQALEQHSTQY